MNRFANWIDWAIVSIGLLCCCACADPPIAHSTDVSGRDSIDASADTQPDCRDWRERLEAVSSEGNPYGFADDEIGARLRRYMKATQTFGPASSTIYWCARSEVREFPHESATRLEAAYNRIPHRERLGRKALTIALTELRHEAAIEPLVTIATQPVQETFEDPGVIERENEEMIRSAAISGLWNFANSGIGRRRAVDGLKRVVLEQEEDKFQRKAAWKLKSLGMSRNEFAELVRDTDSEWLLEEVYS